MEYNINKEISECLNCKTKPCTKGCPLANNIPEVIRLTKEYKYEQAYNELTKTTVLPSICGRICPHMKQCMGKCIKGIKAKPVLIGNIEAYIGDMAIQKKWKLNQYSNNNLQDGNECLNKLKNNTNKKVAIIGGGPAGLTCAAFLARNGINVTIYEKETKLGGLLRYGIPEFRLSRDVLDQSINKILELGINVIFEAEIGRNLDLSKLEKEYNAIFIAIGANVPGTMGIEGENLDGVYGGNLLLNNIENNKSVPNFQNKNVAIIGGGNVAMDCARTIKRLGANNVKIIYRRAKEQMPAEEKEIENAINEGIEILFKTNIVKIIGNTKVQQIECINTELIKKDGTDTLVAKNIENSNYKMDIDYVITAIGAQTQKSVLKQLKINLNDNGYIYVDENYRISNTIWAGGDVIGNKSTVAWACFYGRQVAENIASFLNK